MIKRAACSFILLALLASSVSAQFIRHPARGTLADLGTCDADTEARLRSVTDGDSVGDCDPTGTGDETVFCECSEIGGVYAWRPISGIIVGTTAPSSCVDGQFFIDTDTTSGQRIHACESGVFVLQGGGAAADDTLAVSQVGHGFSVAQWIMYDSSVPEWTLLDISSGPSALADVDTVGFVVTVPGVDDFSVAIGGRVSYAHGFAVGPLYASATPGVATSTEPALGTISWLVATATASDKLIVMQRGWWQQ